MADPRQPQTPDEVAAATAAPKRYTTQGPKTRPLYAFQPHAGPQAFAYSVFVRELLYGGAKGGGKTALALAKFMPLAVQFGPDAVGIVIRQSYPELEQVIAEGMRIFVRTGWAEWIAGAKEFRFKTGAVLRLRFIERYEDCQNYQGHEYIYIVFEEAGNFPDHRIFEEMSTCLRSARVPDQYWQIIYTANPGGQQHEYLRNRFGIYRFPNGMQYLRDKAGRIRLFVKARVTDNPSLAGTSYEEDLKNIADPVKRRAYYDGDWDIVAGAYFDGVWSTARNVVEVEEQPPIHWPVMRSLDWGSREPFCVLWWTVANDDVAWDGRYWPRNAVVVLREWAGESLSSENKGLHLTGDELGAGIAVREERWGLHGRTRAGPADGNIFHSDGGPSLADMIYRGSKERVTFTEAYKARVTGWQEMSRRLKEGTLVFHRRCNYSIRTIPVLKHDEKDIEDIDTKQNDHAADTVRYICNQFIRPPMTAKQHKALQTRKWKSRNLRPIDAAFGY